MQSKVCLQFASKLNITEAQRAHRVSLVPINASSSSCPKQRLNHLIVRPTAHLSYPLRCRPRSHASSTCRAVAENNVATSSLDLVLCEDARKFYKKVATDDDLDALDVAAPQDFYELLNIPVSSSPEDIRAAYRRLQRMIHPDLVGKSATDLVVLLNRGYDMLMDPEARATYDMQLQQYRSEFGSFTGRPVSRWCGPAEEQRAVFVDEGTCVGCRQCTNFAPRTFAIEEVWGRARVTQQWADDEDSILQAMDLCPVSCIYYVDRKELALLEYVMKTCPREDTAMMARRRSGNVGMAPASANPFTRAETFLRNRKVVRVLEEAEKIGSSYRFQDELLAAAIARAWLQLPADVRNRAWEGWGALESADMAMTY